jgi:RNA polymerase sigma factor (sigma-70 family)
MSFLEFYGLGEQGAPVPLGRGVLGAADTGLQRAAGCEVRRCHPCCHRHRTVSLPPFEQVVAEHGTRVLRVTRALLAPQDAEDAAADALLAALEAYPRLRSDSDIRAWLVTIAHRKALDVLRRRSRHAVPVEDVPERLARSGSDARVDPTADAAVSDEPLWTAVRALPDKQRQAVAYRYVGDLAYADVAAVMGSARPPPDATPPTGSRPCGAGIPTTIRAIRPTRRTGARPPSARHLVTAERRRDERARAPARGHVR